MEILLSVHLIQKPLKLTQGRLVAPRVSADGHARADDIKSVVKGIDKYESMHGVSKVPGHAKGGDDEDDAQAGKGRSKSGDDLERFSLRIGEGYLAPAVKMLRQHD